MGPVAPLGGSTMTREAPRTVTVPADAQMGAVNVSTIVSADDGRDVLVLLTIGPYQAAMSAENAAQLGAALSGEAAYAATIAAGYPVPRSGVDIQ